MTTREEIESAAERLARHQMFVVGCKHVWSAHGQCQWCHSMRRDVDASIVAEYVIAERAERQRRIEAAAREVVDEIIAIAERLMVNEFRYTREMLGEVTTKIITRYLDGETT